MAASVAEAGAVVVVADEEVAARATESLVSRVSQHLLGGSVPHDDLAARAGRECSVRRPREAS